MARSSAGPGRGSRSIVHRLGLGSVVAMVTVAACSSPTPEPLDISIGISPGSRILAIDDAERADEFEAMADLGASWVRLDLDWSRIESERGELDWTTMDQSIDAARAAGLEVLALVTYTPRWARPEGTSGKHPPNDVADFEAFVRLAVNRYESEIGAWEIWNEPNIPDFWEPGADPATYSQLFEAAAAAIHDEDTDSVVITGGLAPAGDGDGEMSPISFLTELFTHLEPGIADAVGVHPYGFPLRPSRDSENNLFQQLPAIVDLVESHEGRRVDLWLTEFGAPTGTSKQAVSPLEQAAILGEALGCVGAWHSIGVLFLYNLSDPENGDPADREDNFGLIGSDGEKKPAWEAVRKTLEASEAVDPCGF